MCIPQDSPLQSTQQSTKPAAEPAAGSAAEAPAEQPAKLSWTPTDTKTLKLDTFTAGHFGLEQTDPWKTKKFISLTGAGVVGVGVSGLGLVGNYRNSSAQAILRRLDHNFVRLNKLLAQTSAALTSTQSKAQDAFNKAKGAIEEADLNALNLTSHDEIASVSVEGLSDNLKPKIIAFKKASQELSEASFVVGSLPQGDIDFSKVANRQELSYLISLTRDRITDQLDNPTLGPQARKLTQDGITVQLDNKDLGLQARSLYAKDQAIAEAALDLAEHSKLNWVEKLGKVKVLPVMGATISALGLGYELYDYFQDQDPEERGLDIKYDSKSSVLTVTAEDIGGKEKSVTDDYSLDNKGDIFLNRYIDNEVEDEDEDGTTQYDINAIINLYINLANAHNKADGEQKLIIQTQIKHIQDFINAHLDKKRANPEELLGFARLAKLKTLPFIRDPHQVSMQTNTGTSTSDNAGTVNQNLPPNFDKL